MMLEFFIAPILAPMLSHAGKARMLSALVGLLWLGVCTKSGPGHYVLLKKYTMTKKDVRRVLHALQSKIQPLKSATLLPNFRKLSGIFRIVLNVRKLHDVRVLLRTQMSSGSAVEANLVVNYCLIFRMTTGFSQNVLC